MAKSQRDKGARGERELAKTLSKFLSIEVKRNLDQPRDAGHDLDGLPFSVEVKRQEQLRIGAWWEQTVEQAQANGKPPALAYRQNHKQWRFVIPAGIFSGDGSDTALSMTAEVGVELFCKLCSTSTA